MYIALIKQLQYLIQILHLVMQKFLATIPVLVNTFGVKMENASREPTLTVEWSLHQWFCLY